MDILIIGYGSAGKRHARVLNSKFKTNRIFILTNQKLKNSKNYFFIKKIKNIDPKLIIVANETNKHYQVCKLLENKFHNKIIVVEKPVFHKIYDFIPKRNKFYVAYNLRYHPVLLHLKRTLKRKDVFYVEAETSSYLPMWRKNTDYRKSYSADKKRGGGSLLDLSHEIDYILWIFKKFKITHFVNKKISNLKIKSDDFTLIVGEIEKNKILKIKLSYFNIKPKRFLNICLKNKQYYADLLNSKLEIYDKDGLKIKKFKKFNQDTSTEAFYKDLILGKKKNVCTLEQGMYLLKNINK